MISEFEKEYMKKYWELQRLQWENYFEDGIHDLSILDKEVYVLSKHYKDKIIPIDRRSRIASMIIKRNLVDKGPEVSRLRNRLDDLENYGHGILEHIKADRYNYRLELSYRMKSDVMEIIKLRTKLAKEHGFTSYPDLILELEEIDKDKLVCSLEKYLEESLPRAREIIKRYGIKWETWFKDIGGIADFHREINPVEQVNRLLEMLGFEEAKSGIRIRLMNQGYSGVASELSPGDVRIVVEPIKTLNNLRTLFHEAGHAISYSLNQEDGLFKILPSSQDEAMAVVMEYIAPILLLNEPGRKHIYEMMTLEYTRCAISALYEFELWKNPEAAEELYLEYYARLGFDIKHGVMWASDTFRSIDPVYIHNYVIGAMLGEMITSYLQSQYSRDYKKWGDWLYNTVYKHGRGKPFREMIMGDFI